MRIAIDCRLWNEGGVGRYLRNLVFYLGQMKHGHEFILYFYQQIPTPLPKGFSTKVTEAKWHTVTEQTIFARQLHAGNYDLVHFPYFSFPLLYRRPFVLTIHDLTIKHFATGQATTKGWLTYWLKRQAYSLVLNQGITGAKQIIVPTQFVKDDLVQFYPGAEGKTAVTPEGVGYELLDAQPRKPEALKSGQYLLYVGNFYPHKQVDFLVKTFLGLKTNSKLVLAGPHDFFAMRFKDKFREAITEGRIQLLHSLKEEELAWAYSHAQALVFPSQFEGFGLPVIEATYFGCPLVLSDIPVFREIAPLGAVFFEPKNTQDLAWKLSRLSSIRLKTKAEYFKEFSFKRMSEETLRIYNQAV